MTLSLGPKDHKKVSIGFGFLKIEKKRNFCYKNYGKIRFALETSFENVLLIKTSSFLLLSRVQINGIFSTMVDFHVHCRERVRKKENELETR